MHASIVGFVLGKSKMYSVCILHIVRCIKQLMQWLYAMNGDSMHGPDSVKIIASNGNSRHDTNVPVTLCFSLHLLILGEMYNMWHYRVYTVFLAFVVQFSQGWSCEKFVHFVKGPLSTITWGICMCMRRFYVLHSFAGICLLTISLCKIIHPGKGHPTLATSLKAICEVWENTLYWSYRGFRGPV